MITVNGQYFEKDGHPYFYLADTCWGAFTSLEMADWKYYLDTRKREGFNAVQINILRQYDSSKPLPGHEPFAITEKPDGSYEYDYKRLNEAYFDHAEVMLQEMVKRDLQPVLVLLWGNFVPGTWMNDPNNGFVALAKKPNLMPLEAVKPYVTYVTKRFKQYQPIYFVSGDVGFDSNDQQDPAQEAAYYREVYQTAKAVDPDALYTFHINGGSKYLPAEFQDQVDFFSYQSGHGLNHQKTAYKIPLAKREEGFTGPLVDAELCYEGLNKHHSDLPGRYSAFDVRRAAWTATLTGAAGLGYGSFGIWPWQDNYREGQQAESFLEPYDWRTCLTFRGAQDLGLLRQVFEKYAPKGLKPIGTSDLREKGIFAAKSEDYIMIYSTQAGRVDLGQIGIQTSECQIIDLESRQVLPGRIKERIVAMAPVLEDQLIVIKNTKKGENNG